MREATADAPEQDRVIRVRADRSVAVPIAMRSNDVALLTLNPAGP